MAFENLSALLKEYPWLSCDPNLEGVLHDPSRPLITFGAKAGPGEGTVSTALHEMAHFVEIDEDRIASDHWGFHFGTPYFLLDHSDAMPTSLAATKREIRTWAIQLCLAKSVGMTDETPETLSRSVAFMSDAILIPGTTNDAKNAWASSKIREELLDVDQSEVLSEWHRRARLVPELMARRRSYDDLMERVPPVRLEHVSHGECGHLSIALDRYEENGLEMFSLLGFNGDDCVFGREYFSESKARSWFSRIAEANGIEAHAPFAPGFS